MAKRKVKRKSTVRTPSGQQLSHGKIKKTIVTKTVRKQDVQRQERPNNEDYVDNSPAQGHRRLQDRKHPATATPTKKRVKEVKPVQCRQCWLCKRFGSRRLQKSCNKVRN